MRTITFSAIFGAAYLPSAFAQAPLTPRSGGSCQVYPEVPEGGVGEACGFAIAGERVWVWDGMTMLENERQLDAPFDLMNMAEAVIGSVHCVQKWKELYCRTQFMPCTQGIASQEVPQQICKSECLAVQDDICAAGFVTVKAAGFGANVVSCDDTINNAARIDNFLFPNFFSEWDGTEAFPTAEFTLPGGVVPEGQLVLPCWVPGEGGGDATCDRLSCPLTYLEDIRSTTFGDENEEYCQSFKGTTEKVSCAKCASTCKQECPNPVYSKDTWMWIWLCRWVPGIVGIIMLVPVMYSELKKVLKAKARGRGGKKQSSGANVYVLITAVLGLIFSTLDAIPSLFIAEDLMCDGESVLYEDVNGMGNPICEVLRFNVHIQLAMLGAVTITLYELWRKLGAASKMKSYKSSAALKVAAVVVIGVIPMILMIIHTTTEYANGQKNIQTRTNGTVVVDARSLFEANYLRYLYSCGPRFKYVELEWVLVTAPAIVYGAGLTVCSFLLLSVVTKMRMEASKKGSGGSNKTMVNLAITMMKFAVSCVALVLLNLCTVVPFVNQALWFGYEVNAWGSCVATGINLKTCDEVNAAECAVDIKDKFDLNEMNIVCGDVQEFKPPAYLLAFMNLSQTLPSMVFGVLFGYKLLKTYLKSAAVSAKNATSSMSSASSVES